MKPILEAAQIEKFFFDPEPYQVLKNINLTISKGELVSIIGKSGCGKSTLLYILSTLDTDYQGSLLIMEELVTGQKLDDLAQIRNRHLGFVFQFHYLLPEFTVLQNVMLPALKMGELSREEIENKALEKLDLMDMGEYASKLSGKLSGGQQQRVAIARALINDPLIIMADEPTGNLDSYNSHIVLELLQKLSSEGNTIISVTHDKDFARVAHRIIEMADGRILN